MSGGTVLDTGRDLAGDERRRSEERFRAFFENAPIGKVITSPDGVLLLTNRALQEVLGYSGEELSSLSFRAITHPDDLAASDECVRLLLSGERDTYRMEKRYVAKGGATVWTRVVTRLQRDDEGRPSCFLTHIEDVTELRRTQQTLADTRTRADLLWRTMPHGVVHQAADGRIIAMNPAAERILGKGPAEFIGRTSEDEETHTLREDGTPFPAVEHPSIVALRTGREVAGVVMGVLNPREGAYRWIEITAVPLFREGEAEPAEVYTIFEDVTRRKAAEDGLRASRLRMDRALEASRSFTFEWVPATDAVARSASCGAILGLAGDEAVHDTGQGFFQRIQEEDRAAFVGMLEGLSPDRPAYRVEYRVPRPDGDVAVLEEVGQGLFDRGGGLRCLTGVTTDITDRRRAETALRESVAELERFNRLMVGREVRMVELKREVNALCARLGLAPEYPEELTAHDAGVISFEETPEEGSRP